MGRPRSRPRPHRPANLLVGSAVGVARRAARGRAAARRRRAHLRGASRDSLGEPAAGLRFSPPFERTDVVAADHARSAKRRRPGAASSHMTDLRAAMRRAVSDTAEPGAPELCHVLAEALLDSAAEEEGPAGLERVKSHVYRLRIGSNRRARSVVLKRFDPWLARRNELVARRWLPAIGLGDRCPRLLATAADPRGEWVWHVYEDLGEGAVDAVHTDPARVGAVVDLIAELHTRAAGQALLPECRHFCGDLGAPSLAGQARVAGSGAEPPVRDPGIRSLRESRHLGRRGDPPAERCLGLGAARRGRALVRRPGAGAPRLMATIVVSPFDVANFPEGGGHFWVYMQYVQGLSRLGCEVYWLEQFRRGKDPDRDARAMARFFERMERFGLAGRVLLYTLRDGEDAPIEYVGVTRHEAEAVLRRADLTLNFHYAIDPRMLACARRTALVDIDPGLTQLWISTGQLRVPPHDVYFTIGETVGTAAARFPGCGLRWVHIHPPVCLELWPYVHDPCCVAFTTIAGWWSGKWVKVIEGGKEVCTDNNKRVSFLEYATLPDMTRQPLELALLLADVDV